MHKETERQTAERNSVVIIFLMNQSQVVCYTTPAYLPQFA